MAEYRRRLPRFQPDDAYLFLTWRLWGSLPAGLPSRPYPTPGHAFVDADRALERDRTGPVWLKDPRIARLVVETILAGEQERLFYELQAWVVMPNHVHLLILPRVAVPVVTRWLKGSTARRANQLLGHTGRPFWQDGRRVGKCRNSRHRLQPVMPVTRKPIKNSPIPEQLARFGYLLPPRLMLSWY